MGEGGLKSFLEEKYPDLHQSEEVESAVRRQETRTDEKVGQQPKEKIEAYLDRLDEVFNPDEPDKRERRVGILKDKLHELFVIEPPDFKNPDNPINKSWESYFNHQKQIAREQGDGDIQITDEMRGQMAETIIHDQAQGLDAWVDYLGSADATYPNWLKYFAFRSVTKLSEYDKEKHEFKKRSKGTTAPFPDINREALAYVLDAVEKSHKKETKDGATDAEWEKLIKNANFGKLYAHAIEKITPATQEDKENIQGEWVKYEQGSDAEPLYKSLQGHGTGWCTAGEGVAQKQLELGDFYVFYTESKKGKAPRVAIRMQSGEIAEVRGIDADQNLEGSMTGVAKEKMKDLPGAEKYEKRVSDMKQLTDIERKTKKGDGLTKEELRFLYEMDGQIDGFGYKRDPRIREILESRDGTEDYPIIFECSLSQIAFNKEQIRSDIVAYIGEWTPEVLSLLPENINKNNVYEDFPKKKVFWRTIETDPDIKNAEEAKIAILQEGMGVSDYAVKMLEKTAFSGEKKEYEIVCFSVESLGFKDAIQYSDIVNRAKELGLKPCPAELVPQLRLQYKDQNKKRRDESLNVAIEPAIDSLVFCLYFHRGNDRVVLSHNTTNSYYGGLNPAASFLFVRSRKSEKNNQEIK